MSIRKRSKLIAGAFRNVILDRRIIEQFNVDLHMVLVEAGVEQLIETAE